MEIKVYKGAREVCLQAATRLAELARAGGGNVALSGGNTPKLLFSLLPEFSGVPWRHLTFFWVDERMVPSQSTESNYGEFYRVPGIPEIVLRDRIFEMVYHENPEDSLRDYEQKLRRCVSWNNGFPRFDLILLGVGEDGHTASIFPDNLSSFTSPFPAEIVRNPYSGQQRITLTGSTINNARQVFFLCTGCSKAEVVEQVIENKNKRLPAAHVAPDGGVVWYLDEAAACKLNNK